MVVKWESYPMPLSLTDDEIATLHSHSIFIVQKNKILNGEVAENARQLWIVDESAYFIDMIQDLIEEDCLPNLERVLLWGRE